MVALITSRWHLCGFSRFATKTSPPYGAQSFISKLEGAGVGHGVLVAMDSAQERLDVLDLQMRAHQSGLDLEIFTDWNALIRAITFASDARELAIVESAVAAIRARLIELEVPADTPAAWDAVTLKGS